MLKAKVVLLVPGAAAKPNPKLGQALGPLGINMAQFCKVGAP
jgi:large subunit ribosomal protein L11